MKICVLILTGLAGLLCSSAFSQVEVASRNAAACKIEVNSWCGSGSLCGYWTDDEGNDGALVLTNSHVATSQVGKRVSCTFVMKSGQARQFTGINIVNAYSERDAVDWAFVFVPGLTFEVSGIKPLKLSKDDPVGQVFQFTGSPRCVWPQTSIDIRLVQSTARGVVMWQPVTIGGQSGSSVRRMLDGGGSIAEILLTWSWNRNGAGQPTSLIYNNVQNKNNVGPERPEGLVEVFMTQEQRDSCQAGYFESEMFSPKPGVLLTAAPRVVDLPVWWEPGEDPTDPIDPTDPVEGLTEAETAAVLSLKEAGYDLEKLSAHYLDLILGGEQGFELKLTEELLPAKPSIEFPEVQPKAAPDTARLVPAPKEWTAPVGPFIPNQVHDGRVLTKDCLGNGTCRWVWKIAQ